MKLGITVAAAAAAAIGILWALRKVKNGRASAADLVVSPQRPVTALGNQYVTFAPETKELYLFLRCFHSENRLFFSCVDTNMCYCELGMLHCELKLIWDRLFASHTDFSQSGNFGAQGKIMDLATVSSFGTNKLRTLQYSQVAG
jgi:hypothetical protein